MDLVAIMEVVWFCVLGYIGVLYLTAIKEALGKVVKELRYIRYTHMLFYFGDIVFCVFLSFSWIWHLSIVR